MANVTETIIAEIIAQIEIGLEQACYDFFMNAEYNDGPDRDVCIREAVSRRYQLRTALEALTSRQTAQEADLFRERRASKKVFGS